jgi:hypothetical protein
MKASRLISMLAQQITSRGGDFEVGAIGPDRLTVHALPDGLWDGSPVLLLQLGTPTSTIDLSWDDVAAAIKT